MKDTINMARFSTVAALAEGQALASGRPAVVGAHGRLGNVGDGNIIQEVLRIPTVQYGPGLQGMANTRRAGASHRPRHRRQSGRACHGPIVQLR
jgi:hypothetical protein